MEEPVACKLESCRVIERRARRAPVAPLPPARSSRWKIGDDLKELRCVSQVFEIAYLAGPCVMLGRLRSSHSNGMQELYRLAWSSMATRPL